jgi:hypothetical protein
LTLRRLLLLLCAALCLVAPASARADGDPASDFLLFGPYYVPLQPPPAKPVRDELNALLRGAATQKKPLRVAVIRTKEDLGAFPQLFGKPKPYARLLANEIAFAYKGPLLIVMPQGFATRHIPAAREKLLSGLKIDATSPDAMTRTTIDASRRLLTAAGVDVSKIPPAPDASSGSGTSVWVWVAIGAAVVVVVLLVAGGLVVVLRRRAAT